MMMMMMMMMMDDDDADDDDDDDGDDDNLYDDFHPQCTHNTNMHYNLQYFRDESLEHES